MAVRRSARVKIGFALLTVALVFGAAEGVARVWVARAAQVDQRWLNDLLTVPDADRIYGLRPGVDLERVRFDRIDWTMRPCWQGEVSIAINRHGLRDGAFRARKPAGATRVICLGDSIVFAQEVDHDQTFAHLLEQSLADRLPGGPVEVLNAGVFGYSSEQVLATLRGALDFDPDLLVLVMPANDVGLSSQSDRELIASMNPGAVWLQRQLVRSRLFLLLRARLRGHTPPRAMGGVMQVSHEQTRENVERMAALAGEAGIPLVIVLPHHQDWPPPFNFGEHRSVLWPTAREVARQHGLAVVDLTPAFTAGPAGELLVDSCHMNARGHQVAADQILPVIEPLLAR